MKRTDKHNGILVVAGLALALAAACSAPGVPEKVTWAEHVKPILAAKCVHCHGYPGIQGAGNTFRLDVYDSTFAPDGRRIHGAVQMANWMRIRTDSRFLDGPVHEKTKYSLDIMPPAPESLTDEQRDILTIWGNEERLAVLQELPLRGERENNAIPTLEFTRPLADSLSGDLLTIQYILSDPDHETATGELCVGANATDCMRVGALESGRHELVWDVGTTPVGTQTLFAIVKDGSGEHPPINVGTYDVTRANANAAPTVTIRSPHSYSVAGDATPFDISFDIADPDSAAFTVTLVARGGDNNDTITIVDEVPAFSDSTNTIAWNTSSGVTKGNWTIEVRVNDGTATRSKTSPSFIVGNGADMCMDDATGTMVTPTHAHVAASFDKCNNCHGGPLAPDLAFGSYPDAFKARGKIFWRVFRQRNMPPESFRLHSFDISPTDTGPNALDPQLSENERDCIGAWILAGAPEL